MIYTSAVCFATTITAAAQNSHSSGGGSLFRPLQQQSPPLPTQTILICSAVGLFDYTRRNNIYIFNVVQHDVYDEHIMPPEHTQTTEKPTTTISSSHYCTATPSG